MTLWLAYVPHGQEFALVEDCEVLGITATVPRKVEAVRTGNNRWPEPRVIPYLPNYAFVRASAEEWHWLREIRYVRDLMGILPQEERKVAAFIDAVEGEFAIRHAEIEQAQKVLKDREASKEARRAALSSLRHYAPGDLLEVITGPFAGRVAAFGAMIERAASLTPLIEAEIEGLRVQFDPLMVRKAG